MAVKIEANDIFAIHEGYAYTTTDAKHAKAWSDQRNGEVSRGRVSGKTLTEWREAGSPAVEPLEKKSNTVNNDEDVVATLIAKKLLSNGKLGKQELQFPITRKLMRETRGAMRGRPSSENYLNCAIKLIEDQDVAPIQILEANDTVHNVTEQDSGEYSISRDKDATEGNLRAANRVLTERLEAVEAELAAIKSSQE